MIYLRTHDISVSFGTGSPDEARMEENGPSACGAASGLMRNVQRHRNGTASDLLFQNYVNFPVTG